jgi:hypothetical protein
VCSFNLRSCLPLCSWQLHQCHLWTGFCGSRTVVRGRLQHTNLDPPQHARHKPVHLAGDRWCGILLANRLQLQPAGLGGQPHAVSGSSSTTGRTPLRRLHQSPTRATSSARLTRPRPSHDPGPGRRHGPASCNARVRGAQDPKQPPQDHQRRRWQGADAPADPAQV